HTLSLHDALPISAVSHDAGSRVSGAGNADGGGHHDAACRSGTLLGSQCNGPNGPCGNWRSFCVICRFIAFILRQCPGFSGDYIVRRNRIFSICDFWYAGRSVAGSPSGPCPTPAPIPYFRTRQLMALTKIFSSYPYSARRRRWLGMAISALGLGAWSAHAVSREPLPVVATFSILGDMVKEVGGDRVSVTTIVGPNTDSHGFEPKPQDAKALLGAKVLVLNGLDFEPWLPRLSKASGFEAMSALASAGAKVRHMADSHQEAAGKGKGKHDHAHGRKPAHA